MSTETNILAMDYESRGGTSTSTSSTTTRARAREVMDYAAAMGLKPTGMMENWVEQLLNQFEAEVLKAVVDETILAPAPSWRYFSAIVRRLLRECPLGVYTFDRWLDRQDRWEQSKMGGY